MSTDYAAKERAFIASLAEETGRDLEGWMAAIGCCGHNARNDIIDWLRLQGFQFSRASWIERIHHNGGRLIYAGEDVAANVEEASGAASAKPAARLPETSPEPQPDPGPQLPTDSRSGDGNGDIERLLASAKGLRPLAEAIVAEVSAAAGGCVCRPDGRLIMVFSGGFAIAAILPGARQVRLYADFGRRPAPRVVRAEPIGKVPAPFPDMIAMDDARRIDAEFRAALVAALRPPISKTA